MSTPSRHLLTESRSRKVIIVTHPFLPDPIRHLVAQVLLDNLQVSPGVRVGVGVGVSTS